jgi:hypothetical protein
MAWCLMHRGTVCANCDVEHVSSPALDVAGCVNADNTAVSGKGCQSIWPLSEHVLCDVIDF